MTTLSKDQIKASLLEMGCNEWKKGNHHRIYFDGVDAKRVFDDEHAEFGKSHKVYFDVNDGEFKCSNKSIENNLNCMISD